MSIPLPSPIQAAETLQRNPSELRATREQARSAGLLAQMMADAEQSQLIGRALEALSEPADLATQVYLVGRVYLHVAKVYAKSTGAAKMQLVLDGPPAGEVYLYRAQFLQEVSRLLTSALSTAA